MKLKIALIFSIVLSLFIVNVAASMVIPANDNALDNSKAAANSPVIGDNFDLERVDFIHYAKSYQSGAPAKQDACYKLMGVKWLSYPVNYVINPANTDGLSDSFVTNTISASAETWDLATSRELFNNAYGIDYSAQYGVSDHKNSIVFGNYPDSGVIGVTSVWYSRVGKQIVEFDMLLNTDFAWGDASINPALMDLRNIVTHELGHSVGLSDIYSTSCTAVTMYGYSTEGDISKRTLETADMTGLQKMYGI